MALIDPSPNGSPGRGKAPRTDDARFGSLKWGALRAKAHALPMPTPKRDRRQTGTWADSLNRQGRASDDG